MKKILITGSSGYIGSHLCKMLNEEYEIHGIDIVPPKVVIDQFFMVDINKPFTGNEIIYDAVIHLAALVNVSESEKRPISYYVTNINGTMNVINKMKTKNFIFSRKNSDNVDAITYAYNNHKTKIASILKNFI